MRRGRSAMWLSTSDLSMDEPDRDGQTNLRALPCAFTPEPILLSMHFIWILMTGPIRAEDKKTNGPADNLVQDALMQQRQRPAIRSQKC